MKPIARATAREINETIRYTCWAVFARGDQPGEGAEARLQACLDALADQEVVVRGLYDVSGMRADADLMVWLHAPTAELVQAAVRRIRRDGLGECADLVFSGVAMHRPAAFNKGHVPAFMTGAPAQDLSLIHI